MSEEIKKEAQNLELNLDNLEQVSGGAGLLEQLVIWSSSIPALPPCWLITKSALIAPIAGSAWAAAGRRAFSATPATSSPRTNPPASYLRTVGCVESRKR